MQYEIIWREVQDLVYPFQCILEYLFKVFILVFLGVLKRRLMFFWKYPYLKWRLGRIGCHCDEILVFRDYAGALHYFLTYDIAEYAPFLIIVILKRAIQFLYNPFRYNRQGY